MKELRLIDTFSGIGGFSYAAETLVGGFKTVAFVECEPYCQKVLNKHWPDVPIYDDIKTYKPEIYSADVICGGFPCQDISRAGGKKGITKETRSGLFYDLMRVIRMVRPRFIVMENVAAIINNGMDIVLRELYTAGFDAEWATFPATMVGACHTRNRWWLVAYPHGNRLQREIGSGVYRSTWPTQDCRRINKSWRQYECEPILHRGDDGLRNRIHRSKALGNSVLPACAAIPLQRVKDLSML